jgi:predicted nucleic acid-binding protein
LIVLDSSFLIGFYNERDAHHPTANALMKRFLSGEWGAGLLLEYVLVEVVTVLLLRRDLVIATRVGRLLLDATELEFVPCSDLFAEAMNWFSIQSGTQLSFTDSAIAVVALDRADGQVLTFDHEFQKIAGLRINPVSSLGS